MYAGIRSKDGQKVAIKHVAKAKIKEWGKVRAQEKEEEKDNKEEKEKIEEEKEMNEAKLFAMLIGGMLIKNICKDKLREGAGQGWEERGQGSFFGCFSYFDQKLFVLGGRED